MYNIASYSLKSFVTVYINSLVSSPSSHYSRPIPSFPSFLSSPLLPLLPSLSLHPPLSSLLPSSHYTHSTTFIVPHADLVPITDDGLVSVIGLVITWTIPASTMQFLRTYRLTISDDSTGDIVHDVLTNDTSFDASSLVLSIGSYSVKVSIQMLWETVRPDKVLAACIQYVHIYIKLEFSSRDKPLAIFFFCTWHPLILA